MRSTCQPSAGIHWPSLICIDHYIPKMKLLHLKSCAHRIFLQESDWNCLAISEHILCWPENLDGNILELVDSIKFRSRFAHQTSQQALDSDRSEKQQCFRLRTSSSRKRSKEEWRTAAAEIEDRVAGVLSIIYDWKYASNSIIVFKLRNFRLHPNWPHHPPTLLYRLCLSHVRARVCVVLYCFYTDCGGPSGIHRFLRDPLLSPCKTLRLNSNSKLQGCQFHVKCKIRVLPLLILGSSRS